MDQQLWQANWQSPAGQGLPKACTRRGGVEWREGTGWEVHSCSAQRRIACSERSACSKTSSASHLAN